MLKQLSISFQLIEALEKMPSSTKFMKDMITKKRYLSFEAGDMLKHCSSIATRSIVHKKEDPVAFIICYTIGLLKFSNTLCDI